MKNFTRYFIITVCLLVYFNADAFSRTDTIRLGRSFGMQIGGFARVDYIFDTRQTSEAVEGLFTFYPLSKQLDENGDDINATPKANFISIATRLGVRFFTSDFLGAKASAYVEFDFTGTSNTNGVRLRQANVNLAWSKTNLLVGRTWHPFSISCMPNVVGLNTGAPFFAFNRSDQIRFDYKPGNWALSAIALYQSDYASWGPQGKSAMYMRDAVLPEFNAGVAFQKSAIKAGLLASIKTIKPRLYTHNDSGNKFKTTETLTTYAAQAYLQYQKNNWMVKLQGLYTQNLTESLMFGGYAVKDLDPLTGHEKYTPTQHMSYWLNVDYGKKVQVGLFAGYLNNLGTTDNVIGTWYARAPEVKYLYRVSPHIFYNMNNWQLAAEVEYTAAAYGEIQNNNKAKVINASEVGNFRANLMLCFYF